MSTTGKNPIGRTPIGQHGAEIRTLLAACRQAATERDRSDLVDRLDAVADRADAERARVLVLGAYKSGKTELINALLAEPLLPTDTHRATTVPTVLTYTEERSARVFRAGGGTGRVGRGRRRRDPRVHRRGDPRRLRHRGGAGHRLDVVARRAGPAPQAARDRAVARRHPRRSRRERHRRHDGRAHLGGVGGRRVRRGPRAHRLGALAAHHGGGALRLGLSRAHPHRPAPALAPRRRPRPRAPARRRPGSRRGPADLRRAAAARRRDRRPRPRRRGGGRGARRAPHPRCRRRSGAAGPASSPTSCSPCPSSSRWVRTELAALADPATAHRLAREAEDAKVRVAGLRDKASRWQQTLNDLVSDLVSDVEYDLRDRLRAVTGDAEEALEETDPAKTWDQFAPWLSERVSEATATNVVYAEERTRWLAKRVAVLFAEDGEGLLPTLDLGDRAGTADPVRLLAAPDNEKFGLSQSLMIGMRGSYGGVLMIGMITTVAGMALLNPLSLGAGVLLGSKTLFDERRRARRRRQAEAKQAVRRHVDDVVFRVGKNTRDMLREVQRTLRDHFSATARELDRSLSASTAAATAAVAAQADPATRERRTLAARTTGARLQVVLDRAASLRATVGDPDAPRTDQENQPVSTVSAVPPAPPALPARPATRPSGSSATTPMAAAVAR